MDWSHTPFWLFNWCYVNVAYLLLQDQCHHEYTLGLSLSLLNLCFSSASSSVISQQFLFCLLPLTVFLHLSFYSNLVFVSIFYLSSVSLNYWERPDSKEKWYSGGPYASSVLPQNNKIWMADRNNLSAAMFVCTLCSVYCQVIILGLAFSTFT